MFKRDGKTMSNDCRCVHLVSREGGGSSRADLSAGQMCESNSSNLTRKYELLAKEFRELQTTSSNQQITADKKLRICQDQKQSLQEEIEEAKLEVSSLDRQYQHQLQEVDKKHSTLQVTLESLRRDLSNKSTAFQESQDRLAQREGKIDLLESELLSLKNLVGDARNLESIKKEFSEQATQMRTLETISQDQLIELKRLRQSHKAVGILKEEKRVLESKLRMMDGLEREMGEIRFQRQILEDERRSWISFLQSAGAGNEFDCPEAVARALVQERLQKTSLLEQLGAVRPEIIEKEEIIRGLESDRHRLQAEIEKAKTGTFDNRAKARLERQKVLALKEVEYLREQLRIFDSEDCTEDLSAEDGTAEKQRRVEDLEALVSQYRNELQVLNSTLSSLEAQSANSSSQASTSNKRTYDDADTDERVGLLSRKNRTLQADLSTLQQSAQILQAELAATKDQLRSMQQTARTRVLSLRSNPTDDFEAYKLSFIETLRTENRALLAQLEQRLPTDTGSSGEKLVPLATFESTRLELKDLEKQVADREKRMLRLKQIWSQKGLEMREAVASLLGWKMDFMPNGRFRLTSIFNPSLGEEDEEEKNSFIFDGEGGTMKISSGPDSDFARQVGSLIKFWVNERREIPAFLAACTMEFYEMSTRAARVG